MVQSECKEFDRKFIWLYCLRGCHLHQGYDNLILDRFSPVSVCGRPLGVPFDNVDSELVRVRVDKGAEELRPPYKNKP